MIQKFGRTSIDTQQEIYSCADLAPRLHATQIIQSRHLTELEEPHFSVYHDTTRHDLHLEKLP